MLLATYFFSSIMMLAVFLRQLQTKDASYVDVAWAGGIGLAVAISFIYLGYFDWRHSIIALLACLWSVRLSWHLYARLCRFAQEDSRYQTMRQALGKWHALGFFAFFQLQAFFVVLFFAPILVALQTTSSSWAWTDSLACLIFILSFIGEHIADKQLANHCLHYGRKKTCQSGLWYYSRHPNYFFECLHWFTYAFFSWSSPYFYWTLLMPALMFFFIYYVTGIPHTEREAAAKRADYADYQKTTSVLIPWFKKEID